MSPTNQRLLLILGAIGLPLLIVSVYLLVTRRLLWVTGTGDYAALALGIAAGVICIWRIPGASAQRIAASAIYVVAASGVLAIYSLTFVCGVFGDCL